jgi:hypothetical protein
VLAPSSKENPDLWQCAGRGESWVVSKPNGEISLTKLVPQPWKPLPLPPQITLTKEMIGKRSLLETERGWLVGFSAGEFGGGLWWFGRDGRNPTKLSDVNVHAIYRTQDGTFVLMGLAHLSMDDGEIDRFTEIGDKVSLDRVADLGGSPDESMVEADGEILVASWHHVVRIDHGGNVHELYKSGEELVYPTSVEEDKNGNVFVAMRFFVLLLVPEDNSYHPYWLMPKRCEAFKMVKYVCNCTAKK